MYISKCTSLNYEENAIFSNHEKGFLVQFLSLAKCNVIFPKVAFDFKLGLCIVSRYISVVSILWLYDTYRIIHFSYMILQMVHFYPSSHEICGYIKFFGSKTRQNVLLIHIEYHFMCIVICMVSLREQSFISSGRDIEIICREKR